MGDEGRVHLDETKIHPGSCLIFQHINDCVGFVHGLEKRAVALLAFAERILCSFCDVNVADH